MNTDDRTGSLKNAGLKRPAGFALQALSGPQALAFLPAITLAAYWLGGETALLATALGLPLVIAVLDRLGSGRGQAAPHRDLVTGVASRTDVVVQAHRILSEGRTKLGTTSALAAGIDEFPEFQERLGDQAGMAILRACAERLHGVIRGSDLLGRLDGPRFVIVIAAGERSDLEGLIQLASRIQKVMAEPISIDGTRHFVSVSVGLCPPKRSPEPTGEALIASAEQALDEAQAHGTGGIRTFTVDMRNKAQVRGALANELGAALEDGQLKPWFQPQLCTATGKITGFEVLARWEHPEHGLVPPGEFLPAAEQLGMTGRLGEVMLFQSLAALRAWDAGGVQVPALSLNFSGEELRNPALVDRIRWELDRFELSPERISVEVLETVIAKTTNDMIVRNLRAFSEMGCLVDLDDFGTGYASITNIKRFSVGRIKIDRSFITQIDKDAEQQSVVAAIIMMAERLGLETLAEGVETPEELAMLRRLGCGHVQGYGIARPMPFAEVEPWLDAHEPGLWRAPSSEEDPASPGPARIPPAPGGPALPPAADGAPSG